MSEPTLKVVWRMNDARAERDVLAFWREGKLLSQTVDLKTRLEELCVLAYDGDRVVAVNTAVLEYLDQVRARIAMLRLAVAAEYRQRRIATEISARAQQVLQRWAEVHPAEKVMGVGYVVQTRAIPEAMLSQAVFPNGMILIGHTQRGDQIRLTWFPGATVDVGPRA